MRVGERSSQVRAEAASGGGFGDMLRRARGEGGDRGGRAAAGGVDPLRPPRAKPDEEALARADGAEERAALSGADASRVSARRDAPPRPELAALARALPVAVVAAGLREGAPLALSFGRSLEVELRTGAAGVELLLRPEPRLARAAEAELPHLVAALRLRGVTVARAEVLPRGGGARRPR